MSGRRVTFKNIRHHLSLYWFVLPAMAFIGTFTYFPVVNGLLHSFYTWNGGDVERVTGSQNYIDIFAYNPPFWKSFANVLVLGAFNILKMVPSIVTAVCLHRVLSEKLQFWYRVGFVVPMVVNSIVVVLLWRMFFTNGILNTLLSSTGAMVPLVWFSSACAWISSTLHITTFFSWAGELFKPGIAPNWLGTGKLAWLSVIIWGFPYVNQFGVLVYLAVLQSIGKDVYEAAEVDGIDWLSKFRYIELPLILDQVRLMMFLVLLSTINDAGSMMIFFGLDGGPDGVLQVPAVFMFREAYLSQKMGMACAIGIVLVVIIFLMNKINAWLIQPAE